MFSSDVHVHIVSSPLVEGLLLWKACVRDRGGVIQPQSHESTARVILRPGAPPWSTQEFKGCL